MTVPQSSTLPTLSSITSRLSQSLSTLESSHSLDSASLNHFTHERQDLDHQEQELKLEVEKTERKNRWFQDFEETVEIWCGFLDEKVKIYLSSLSFSLSGEMILIKFVSMCVRVVP